MVAGNDSLIHCLPRENWHWHYCCILTNAVLVFVSIFVWFVFMLCVGFSAVILHWPPPVDEGEWVYWSCSADQLICTWEKRHPDTRVSICMHTLYYSLQYSFVKITIEFCAIFHGCYWMVASFLTTPINWVLYSNCSVCSNWNGLVATAHTA